MSRLFVIGDSFAASPPKGDNTLSWTRLIVEKLHLHYGKEFTLINNSLIGSSQDWMWTHLQGWLHYEMTPEDYLVICLTHPSRVWFLERMPEMTNANIIDLDKWVSKEEAKAIELYIRYMQRPMIDLMNVNNRLAYVAYQVQRKGLKKPILIKCFDQDLDQGNEFPELKIANGSLMSDVQYHEFVNPEAEHSNNFWHGIDPRYNHMLLRNHEILAEKIVQDFINNSGVDLTTGFHKNIIAESMWDDIDFCKQELNFSVVTKNRENKDRFRPIIPWAKRVGVKTGQLDR